MRKLYKMTLRIGRRIVAQSVIIANESEQRSSTEDSDVMDERMFGLECAINQTGVRCHIEDLGRTFNSTEEIPAEDLMP